MQLRHKPRAGSNSKLFTKEATYLVGKLSLECEITEYISAVVEIRLGTAILIDMGTSGMYGSIIVCNLVFGFEAHVKHLPRHL